jgi:hypothetical protein
MGLKVTWGESLPARLVADLHNAVTASPDVTATSTDDGCVLHWVGSKLDPPDDEAPLQQAWQKLAQTLNLNPDNLDYITTDYKPFY